MGYGKIHIITRWVVGLKGKFKTRNTHKRKNTTKPTKPNQTMIMVEEKTQEEGTIATTQEITIGTGTEMEGDSFWGTAGWW